MEDDQFPTAGGRFFGQLPEFFESDFAAVSIAPGPNLGTLYSSGDYYTYYISTYPNDLNSNDVTRGSGATFQPGVTWENSYFNWTYVNG